MKTKLNKVIIIGNIKFSNIAKKMAEVLLLSCMGSYLVGCGGSSSSGGSVSPTSDINSTNASAKIARMSNYLPIQFVDKKNLGSNVPVYVIIKAVPVGGTQQCLMKFDPNGVASCENVTTNTNLFDYEKTTLASLPHDASGNALVYLPKSISGRIYLSVGQPMDMYYDPNAHLVIDPDGFNPRDANYYNLYDKVEFSFNDSGVWSNPTAVDAYALPISMRQDSSVTVKTAGLNTSRSELFSTAQNVFNNEDKTSTHEWRKLLLKYTDVNGNSTDLRLIAPGKAMVSNLAGTNPFDAQYLKSYENALWDYYKTHTLKVDCGEIRNVAGLGNNYIFTGQVNANGKFVFSNGAGNSVTVDKPKDSSAYFGGAGDTFDAANNTPKAIIIRQFTSAFEVGLLPAPNGTLIDKHYFDAKRLSSNFYKQNPLLNLDGGPWYDLYSKAIHSLDTDHTQPVYTFAYDDALGQDGTLHEGNGNNPGVIVITLNNMSGVKIPNPYVDSRKYNVTVTLPSTSTVSYNGTVLQNGQKLLNVTSPLNITINGQQSRIYLNPAIVQPSSPILAGVVINKNLGAAADYTLSFPAPINAPIVPLPPVIPVPTADNLPDPTPSVIPTASPVPTASPNPTIKPTPTPSPVVSPTPGAMYTINMCAGSGTTVSTDAAGNNVIQNICATPLKVSGSVATYYANGHLIQFDLAKHTAFSATLPGVVVSSYTANSITVNLPANAPKYVGPVVNPTPSPSPTVSPKPTVSPTPSPKPSVTPTPTVKPTPTPTVSPTPGATYTINMCAGNGTNVSTDAAGNNVIQNICATPLKVSGSVASYYANGHLIQLNIANHTASSTLQGVVVVAYTANSITVHLPANAPKYIAPTPSPSPTVSPKPTPTVSPTPSPKPSVKPTPSPSPTASPKPTVSPMPSPKPSVTPTPTPTVKPTPTPTVSPTPGTVYTINMCAGSGTNVSTDAAGSSIIQNICANPIKITTSIATYYANGHVMKFDIANHNVLTPVQGVVVTGYTANSMNVNLPANVPTAITYNITPIFDSGYTIKVVDGITLSNNAAFSVKSPLNLLVNGNLVTIDVANKMVSGLNGVIVGSISNNSLSITFPKSNTPVINPTPTPSVYPTVVPTVTPTLIPVNPTPTLVPTPTTSPSVPVVTPTTNPNVNPGVDPVTVTSLNSVVRSVSQCTIASCPSGAYLVKSSGELENIDGVLRARQMPTDQWSDYRYAILLAPGTYSLPRSVEMSYYTQILGLGISMDSTAVNPGIEAHNQCGLQKGDPGFNPNVKNPLCTTVGALNNFWRGLENVKMTSADTLILAASQASGIRRIHVTGNLLLCDWHTDNYDCGFASGGFMANSQIDGSFIPGSQQQWITRNSHMQTAQTAVWNTVYLGNEYGSTPLSPTQLGFTPQEVDTNKWNNFPLSVHSSTPIVSEKPYLVCNNCSIATPENYKWQVVVPGVRKNAVGMDNNPTSSIVDVTTNSFYIVSQQTGATSVNGVTTLGGKSIAAINSALSAGKNLLIMPGRYLVDGGSINVPKNNTILLGLGIPSLTCSSGSPCLTIAAEQGVKVAGITFDAGYKLTSSLVQIGSAKNSNNNSANPVSLYDVYFRIAETDLTSRSSAQERQTISALTLYTNNVVGDNLWVWRADHDKASGTDSTNPVNNLVNWEQDRAEYGVVIYGDNVTMYGLAVEHFRDYQTVWYGENGKVYFYQSEMPYDIRTMTDWICHDPKTGKVSPTKGCASYVISKDVKSHQSSGVGIYTYFAMQASDEKGIDAPSAIIAPVTPGVDIEHIITKWLNGNSASSLQNIVDDYDENDICWGASVVKNNQFAILGRFDDVLPSQQKCNVDSQ